MAILDPNFEDFLKLLNENSVRYLIVGGYAVGFHGFVRATGDLDIFVERSEENASNLHQSYLQFGFKEKDVPPKLFLTEGNIVRIGFPPVRIEVMNSISGVNFSDCFAKAVFVEMGGIEVPFIDLDSLLKNKRASGRPKDLIDIEGLKEGEGTE